VPDDAIKRTLPGTTASFTRNEASFGYGPADWYPGDHPPMPDVVAHGKESAGVRACALCHYPNGQGKMENAHLAGLPMAYFLRQLEAFENGDRRNADPRKENTNEMARMPRGLSDAEKLQAAEYFASMPFRPWVRVVEAEEVPQVRPAGGLMIPIEDAPPMPLGQRIIEVPEDTERMEIMRDPRIGFIAYVPVGSVARGEAIVTTGGGKTIQCGLCHGPGQKGLGDIPGIAGRSASYTMRQLWDIKQGTRKSPGIMEPVVQNLTAEDMLNVAAYLASLPP
jgi:cytochrome c553